MNTDALCRLLRTSLAVGMIVVLSFAVVRFGGTRPEETSIIQMCIAALLLMWSVLVWFDSNASPDGKLTVFLMVLLGYGVIRAWTAEVRYDAWSDLAHFVTMLATLLIAIGWGGQRSWRVLVVATIIVIASLESIYGTVQYMLKLDDVMGVPQYAAYLGRASGTYINPNHGAWLMAVGLMLSLSLALLSRYSWTAKIFLFYAAFCCAVGVAFTFSRGAWLGATAGLLVLSGWLFWKQRLKWIGIALLLIVLAGVIVGLKPALATVRHQGRYNLNDVRITAIWPAAIHVWREQPVMGIGPKQFEDRFRKYRPGQYNIQAIPVRVHNDYLNILVEWGIIGAVLMLCVVGFSWWRWRTAVPQGATPSGNRLAMQVGLAVAATCVMAHATTDFNLYVPANALVFSILLGLIWRPSGDARPASSSLHWRSSFAVLMSLLAFGLFAHASVRWKEQARVDLAINEAKSWEERREYLLEANTICPINPYTCYLLGEVNRGMSFEDPFTDESGAQEAVEWFTRAVSLKPRQSMYWVSLARTQHWLANDDAARESFLESLRLDPQNYRVQAFYGWFLFERGELTDAYRWLKRSQWLNYDDNTLAKYYLPRLEFMLKRNDQWPLDGLEELKVRNPA